MIQGEISDTYGLAPLLHKVQNLDLPPTSTRFYMVPITIAAKLDSIAKLALTFRSFMSFFTF